MSVEGDRSPDDGLARGCVEKRGRARKVCRYTLEPSIAGLAVVREFLRTALEPYGPTERVLPDIVAATHEACKNALVHNPGCESPVDVTCEVLDDSIIIEVSDRGRGLGPQALPPRKPDPEALEGRGIYMIYRLMDAVEAVTGERGTRITMQKKVR